MKPVELNQETYDTLKRLLDRLLGLSRTIGLGDGMLATIRLEANEVQQALGMDLRVALGERHQCYCDVKSGDFFLVTTSKKTLLVHQDDQDLESEGRQPRPRSLATGCFLTIQQDRPVRVISKDEAAWMFSQGKVRVHSTFGHRLK